MNSMLAMRHPERQVAIVCDLCAGRASGPVCVEMCPLSGKALRLAAAPAAAQDDALAEDRRDDRAVHLARDVRQRDDGEVVGGVVRLETDNRDVARRLLPAACCLLMFTTPAPAAASA